MNHLILRTHNGSNANLILEFLEKDENKKFFRFIDRNNRKAFVEQYEKDVLEDELILIKINPDEYSENNWNMFFDNIIENMEKSYIKTLETEWFIYIDRKYPLTIKNKEKAKTIWLLRNPFMAWASKDYITNPKKFAYDIKMIEDEYIYQILDWADLSINEFDKTQFTRFFRNFIRRFDIEHLITFSILFLTMITSPSSFSLNGHKIDHTKFSDLMKQLKIYFNKSDFIKILNSDKETILDLHIFEYNGEYDKIFDDDKILGKFGDFSDFLTKLSININPVNYEIFKQILQNLMYVIVKFNLLSKKQKNFGKDDFLFNINKNFNFKNQNINRNIIKKIDEVSLDWLLNLFCKIDLDEIFKVVIIDPIENPRDNPLDIEKIKVPTPNSPEAASEYDESYLISFNAIQDEIQLQVNNLGYLHGINKFEEKKEFDFPTGFWNGFIDGFNTGALGKPKEATWNKLFETLKDGYGFGYDKGYTGGEIYFKTQSSSQKKQVRWFYDGQRDGYFDSLSQIYGPIYTYGYLCGKYDKQIEESNSGIGQGLTQSIKNYLSILITKPIKDKLIFYEDLIHPWVIQSPTSLMRFLYFMFMSDYDYIPDKTFEEIIYDEEFFELPINLSLLDIKIFLGHKTLPEKNTFKNYNFWLNYTEFKNPYCYPFTGYRYGWEFLLYREKKWQDYLIEFPKSIFNNLDTNPILNTFELFNKNLNTEINNWLYMGNSTPYEFDKNRRNKYF